MIMLPILLALQSAPAQPALDTTPAPWPDDERELGMVDAYSTDSEAETRRLMAEYASCVADQSSAKVGIVLTRDIRSTEYRNGLRNLARANDGCRRKVGLSRSRATSGLVFAAALAEEMLRRDPAPLKLRLARAATGNQAPTYDASDAVAMCVARSAPDEVATLFATPPASAEETAALAPIETLAGMCSRDAKLEISPVGLRSIVATASYRLLAAQES
jgi:hypothetical protein